MTQSRSSTLRWYFTVLFYKENPCSSERRSGERTLRLLSVQYVADCAVLLSMFLRGAVIILSLQRMETDLGEMKHFSHHTKPSTDNRCSGPAVLPLGTMLASVAHVAIGGHVDVYGLWHCNDPRWCLQPVLWVRTMLMSVFCTATRDHAEFYGPY